MRIAFLLILFTISLEINVFGQKSSGIPPKDFIIANSGDTIWGRIIGNITPASASLRVTFIDDKSSDKKIYKPYQIKSWHPGAFEYYFESKEYRPLGLPKNESGYGVFMKCYTPYQGTIKLYEYYNTDSQEGFYQTYLERRGQMVEVKYEKFYMQLSEYFSDCLPIATKLKEKKYKKSQLSEIVDVYNKWKVKKV